MKFCRSCYAALEDDETVCHACEAKWPERTPVNENVPEEKAPKPQSTQVVTSRNRSTTSKKGSKTAILKLVNRADSIFKQYAERHSAPFSGIKQWIDTEFLHPNLLALVLFAAILGLKIWFSEGRLYQNWDGYVYLLNARSFDSGGRAPPNYFEVLRPPLYPIIISMVWRSFGESNVLAVIISPIFTVAAAALLYLLVKEMFDARAGLIGSVGFLLSPIIMSNTDAVLVHGLGAFFVMLVVFSLWNARTKPMYYFIGGAASALASLTRYPNMLIVFVAVIFILINLKDSPQNRRRVLAWISLGAVAFVGLWLPWLWWCQSVYHDPFISLKLAETGLISNQPGHWYFYLVALPVLLTLPGVGLLLLGLVTKDWLKDRRRLLLAASYLAFLLFYSVAQNQDLRFMVDWAPPLFGLIGAGVSTYFVFLKIRRIRGWKILSVSMSAIIGIWLIFMLLNSVAAETQFLSTTAYGGVFGSVDSFQLSASWLQQHMNSSEIGIADLAPYFSYYTHRFFYSWEYLLEVVSTKNITVRDAMMLLHLKFAVFTDYFARVHNINTLTFLTKVQGFNGYSIYQLV